MSNPQSQKITTRAALTAKCEQLRAAGKKIIFTSGAFDLLHAGHVAYLEKARALGDLLIVGLNSDRSIQQYKDPLRPIVPQDARAAVLAGLSSVDFIFIFDETNNQKNVEALKPAVYAKAGDYSKEKLSSASLVEKNGGRVELVSFEEGFSSSSIIDRILARYGSKISVPHESPAPELRPALFVDRDGTLIEHVEYLHEPEKLKLLPGAIEGLKAFSAAGYRIIITTNQPGIGLGYFTKEDFFSVTKELFRQLSKEGIAVDKVYFSPHTQAEPSKDRKPATGMIDRAVSELNIDLSRSVVVGDMTVDVQFGKNAGVKTVLVQTGMGGSDKRFEAKPDLIAANLADAAKQFLK